MNNPQLNSKSKPAAQLQMVTREAEFSDQDFIRFRDLVRLKSGIYFNEKKRSDLKTGVLKAFHYSGFPNTNAYYDTLAGEPSSSTLFKTLVSFLTVGETYFFRHFDVLEKQILPRLIRSHQHDKTLRIWSAGCSTGEEPYTIAMVLDHILPDLAEWKLQIVGTDININSLEYAREAVYRPWSLRSINDFYKEKYFRKKEGLYYIDSAIRKMVRFEYLNLVDDCYPSLQNETVDLDIIFCRNVTIYFEAETTIKVINRFYRCLKDKSYLAVGHAEPSSLIYDQYIAEIFPDAVIYRKDASAKKEMQYKTGIRTREEMFSGRRFQPSGDVTSNLAKLQTQIDKLSNTHDTEEIAREESKKKKISEVPKKATENVPKEKSETPAPKADADETAEIKGRDFQSQEFMLFGEGIDQFQKKQFEEAEKIFKKLIAQFPSNGRGHYMIAHINANLDRIEDAKKYCYLAIEKDSLLIEAYYLLGLIFKEENAFDDSIKMLKKAIYINMNFVAGYYELAVNYFKLGDTVQGRKYLKQTDKILRGFDPETRVGILDDLNARELGMMVKMWDT